MSLEKERYDMKEEGGVTVASVDGQHSIRRGHGDMTKEEAADLVHAHDEFTPQEYSKLRRKFDLILMPMLMILYGLQFSDKTSLSAGVVFGLREDTGLVGKQYNNLTTFFYVAYLCAQIPMAFVLQRFPLGRALATCVIIWGGIVMCLGACNNYIQLSFVRVLLGWFESVVTPGFAIFTTSWYLRKEQTLRQSCYYAMNTFFAMIFSVGIYYIGLNAQKNGGLAAWRVINLFLGGITVGMGIIFLVFGGTPDEVWWLSKREKRMAKARIASNATGGGEVHPWKWGQIAECFRDPQWYCAVLYNLCGNIPNGIITTFQVLLFKSFGFTSLESILFSLPMYGITFCIVIISGVTVYNFPFMRFPLAIVSQAVVCFVMLFVGLANDVGKWGKWIVFCFSAVSTVSTFVVAWPVISMNVAGRTKKAFFGATSLMAYCTGNIIGAEIMLPSDAPLYRRGLTGAAVTVIVNIFVTGFWWFHYHRENKKRAAEAEGMTEEERTFQARLLGEMDATDVENRHFRYLC